MISGAAIGTYDLVSVTDANGCTYNPIGQVVIDTFPTPMVDPLNNQYACEGDQLTIQQFSGTPAGNTFAWTNTTGTDLGFGLSGTGNIGSFTGVNGTGSPISVTVSVIPTSANGCVGPPQDFLVTVNPIPQVSFTNAAIGCEPLTVSFTNTSNPQGVNCIWDFGDGTTENSCGSVSHTYVAGNYDVSLTVTSSAGCTASVTYTEYVIVSQQPHAAFTYAPHELTIEDTEVEFTNESIDADYYEWDFGDNTGISNQVDLHIHSLKIRLEHIPLF